MMSAKTLWDFVIIVTLVIALMGAVGQFWYVYHCRASANARYWMGIKTTNGITLLFVAGLCLLYLFDVYVLGIFVRLAVLLLVYNLAAGGLVSVIRVLRAKPGKGDSCDS